jgi:hypothetical protein
MRLQEVREELERIASTPRLPRGVRASIRKLAQETKRRRLAPAAPAVSRRMTPAIRKAVQRYNVRHPDKTQFEIAQRFRINQGRVSEALHGKRT